MCNLRKAQKSRTKPRKSAVVVFKRRRMTYKEYIEALTKANLVSLDW